MKIESNLKILVQRRAALGDVVMSTAAVRELYKIHDGKCDIDVETEYPVVYDNNPYVRNVIGWQKSDRSAYDVVYNLDDSYELNPETHYVSSMMYRILGTHASTADTSPCLFPSADDQAKVDADIAEIGNKFFAIHMRNWHWALKNIDLGVWAEVLSKVFTERTDYKIVLVGGETDYSFDHPLIFNANGRYTPAQLKHLLDNAACFVGIDSAPFQIAGASNTHVIGLLTHVPPACIMPIRHLDTTWHWTAIQANVECVGCSVRQQRPIRQIVCEKNDYPCNRTWDTDKIAQAILTQLK